MDFWKSLGFVVGTFLFIGVVGSALRESGFSEDTTIVLTVGLTIAGWLYLSRLSRIREELDRIKEELNNQDEEGTK